jgi:hypothetical protein
MATVPSSSRPVLTLAILACLLLLVVSLAAIWFDDGGSPYPATSLRGQAVTIYGGQGVYRYDTLYKATAFRGFDWAGLGVVLPVLGYGVWQYRRGRLQGQLILAGIFIFLGYIYLIGVMGNAFNELFLLWTAVYACGLIGLAVLLSRMAISALPKQLEARFPRRGLAIYLLVLGFVLLFQYLAQIIASYTSGKPPEPLAIYTTLELAALELGLMIPLHFAGAVLLWKRNGWGYILGPALAFAAAMTFIALGIAQALYYYIYQGGSLSEVIMLCCFAAAASLASWFSFYGAQETEAPRQILTSI